MKLLNQLILILKAFWNLLTNKHENLSEKRLAICNTCDLIDKKGSKCVVSGTQPCCGVCGCSLKLLTRSFESECPHPKGNKWNSLIKTNAKI